MTLYFIKCKSGYWCGYSFQKRRHLYSKQKRKAVKYFSKTDANEIAKSWRDQHTMKKLKKFSIEQVEYIIKK